MHSPNRDVTPKAEQENVQGNYRFLTAPPGFPGNPPVLRPFTRGNRFRHFKNLNCCEKPVKGSTRSLFCFKGWLLRIKMAVSITSPDNEQVFAPQPFHPVQKHQDLLAGVAGFWLQRHAVFRFFNRLIQKYS